MAARTAARNLTAISAHKAAQLAGAFAFAAFIPRRLGPELFGQLVFVLSLSLLLQMAGELGGLDILGRHVPGWAQQGRPGQERIRWLFWQLTWARLAIGLAIVLGLALAAPWLAPWLNRWQGLLIGLGVALRLLSWTPYHLCFGLNQMGRWSVEVSWRQLIMIPCLVVGLPWGLSGLLAGLLLSEAVFLLPGLLWVRPVWRPVRPDWPGLRPYLRFGAGFFLANIIIVLLYRSGPVLLEVLTHDTVAVGYLGLALSLYMLVITVLTQYIASFTPTLALLHTRQQHADARRWLDLLLRYSAILMGALLIGIALLTFPVAPLLFGADFAAVGPIFLLLSLTLLAQPLVWAGRYAAAAFGCPRVALAASCAGFGVCTLAGLLLIPTLAAVGAALALAAGVFVTAASLSALGRAWLRPPWPALLLIFAPLLVLLPLLNAARPLPSALILTVILVPAYLLLLWRLHVAPTGELRRALAAFLGAQGV
jgi:O-antigen/teichoic acid export membrane protein